MDETPGRDPLEPTPALPDARPTHRSARRRSMSRAWRQSTLVGIVFALGLLQGSRAALGRMPDAAAPGPLAQAEVPGASAREADTVRGHFFRPEGSTAVRPALQREPSRWTPAVSPRVALACRVPGC